MEEKLVFLLNNVKHLMNVFKFKLRTKFVEYQKFNSLEREESEILI